MTRLTNPPAGTPANAPRSTAPQRGRQQGPTVDPIRILRQHAWLLAGAAGAGLVFGAAAHFAALWVYPLWGGTVMFEIRPEVTGAKEAVVREIVQDEAVARLGQTESQKMVSKSVLEAAMKAPDIGNTRWGESYPTVDERVEELEDELRVGHKRGTQLFTLSWRAHDKNDVPTVLNRVADTYMSARESEDNERAARSKAQFEQKKTAVEDEIRTLKAEIQDFIRKNGITAGSERDLSDQRSTENLARLQADTIRDLTLSQARLDNVDRRIVEQRYEDEDRRRSLEDMSIRQLERDMQNIQVNLSSARKRYGDAHPAVRALEDGERSASDRYKAALEESMRRNLLADKTELAQRVGGLKELVAKQTEDRANAERRLQELTAQISALDALKEQLTQKESTRKDLQNLITDIDLLQAREDFRRVRLVQRAVTPKELDFPQLKYMIPGGAVLMLVLVGGIVFLREVLDQRVKQPSDLAGMGGARLLGVIPDLSDDPSNPKSAELVVLREPASMTAEMFRQASAALRKAIDAGGFRSIAVVSAHPGAGTTTLVSNLAASSHAAGRSVAVVDANFRRPRLASVMGCDPDAPGLGDMLLGRSVEPQDSHGIHVYGAGTPESRVFERLSGDEIRRAIQRLRDKHQIVIVDLPPSLVAGESMVLADCCDAALVVVRAMQDQRGLVAKTIGQVQETHAELMGTILMRPQHTAGGYFRKNAEIMAEYARPEGAAAPVAEPAKS